MNESSYRGQGQGPEGVAGTGPGGDGMGAAAGPQAAGAGPDAGSYYQTPRSQGAAQTAGAGRAPGDAAMGGFPNHGYGGQPPAGMMPPGVGPAPWPAPPQGGYPYHPPYPYPYHYPYGPYPPGPAQGYYYGGGTGPGPQAGQTAGMGGLVDELANGGSGLSSLSKMLNLDDGEFWKGALVGAAAVLLLTNESVQSALFKAGAQATGAVKTGVDKAKETAVGLKERFAEARSDD
ncbi:hypothetical protein ABC977_16155 [Thioalkalicoccus limnaeus]|uniref:YtxH domain-containing protein n=1 Tax=Thioalkalicoccus limnaeus TaxID=120681 RepID=A0ABV4BHC8_9GAMM